MDNIRESVFREDSYHQEAITGIPNSPEVLISEKSYFPANLLPRQISQCTPGAGESEHCQTDDISTAPSTPYSAVNPSIACQMYPSSYASSTDWSDSAIGPETFDSVQYFPQTCNISSGNSRRDYIAPPALSVSSYIRRPRSCPDELEDFRAVPNPGAILGQSQEAASYCLASSPSCESMGSQKRSDGYLMSRLQSLSPSQPSPMLTSLSPDLAWNQSPLRSPQSTCKDVASNEPENEESLSDQPYAKLIWQAMMETPQKKMTLRQIYDWFKQNTTKPSDSGTNGWQNSIRHNLSMNQAFESEKADSIGTRHTPKKSNNVWALTAKAVENGVESTTRYRNKGNLKKSSKTRLPAPQRQKSGAKGGRAARRAAKQRQIDLDRTFPTQGGPSPRFDEPASMCTMFSSPYPIPGSPITPVLESTLSCPASMDRIFTVDETPNRMASQASMHAETTIPRTLIESSEEQWQTDPWGAEWLTMEHIQQQSWDGLKQLNL